MVTVWGPIVDRKLFVGLGSKCEFTLSKTSLILFDQEKPHDCLDDQMTSNDSNATLSHFWIFKTKI